MRISRGAARPYLSAVEVHKAQRMRISRVSERPYLRVRIFFALSVLKLQMRDFDYIFCSNVQKCNFIAFVRIFASKKLS